MAKGSKRQRKKLNKKLQLNVIKQSGKIVENINKKSASFIEQIYKDIIAENERKQKRKQKQKERYNLKLQDRKQKLFAFEKATGIHLDQLPKGTVRRFDKVSLKEIQDGYITIENFPELFGSKEIDFNHSYKLQNGMKIHFAFRALNGEIDIADELKRYDAYSDSELIKGLETIKNMPLTGTRNKKGSRGRNVGSSGKAGEGAFHCYSQSNLIDVYANEYNADRRSNTYAKKRNKKAIEKGIGYQHSDIDYHWQIITQEFDGTKAKAYTEITPHKLLVILNAIMYNIKEDTRSGFYNAAYADICKYIPIMKKILP